MGRQCFVMAALGGCLSEPELMDGRTIIWQHCLQVTVFGRLLFALLNFFFIIGRTIQNFRGHMQRNGINVCNCINWNLVWRKMHILRFTYIRDHRLLSSGIWHSAVLQTVASVLEEPDVSIFWLESMLGMKNSGAEGGGERERVVQV
jgi:hypothetical protein